MVSDAQKPTQTARKPRRGQVSEGELLDGRYRVLGVLGRGGFSSVYEAEQIQVGRRVAVKVLDLGLDVEEESTAVARFLQEARTAARLEHPNVVALYDAGVLDDGRPFMVLQRFEGATLKHHLKHHGPMPATQALPLFLGCLDAVARAHELGVVHRDLKPSNLVLTDPGERTEALKVIDFGIAHLQLEQSDLTQKGALIGTVAYLAPEYILEYKVTPALDVYQLGLVLIELLWGRRAVRGEHPMHFAMGHSKGLVDMPASLRASPLGPVLERATARTLEDRYPDAQSFRDALEGVDPAMVPVFERALEDIDERPTSVWDGSSGTLAVTTGQIEPQDTEIRPAATVPTAPPPLASSASPASAASPASSASSASPASSVSSASAASAASSSGFRAAPTAPAVSATMHVPPRTRGLAIAIGTVGVGLLAIAAVLFYSLVLASPSAVVAPTPVVRGAAPPAVQPESTVPREVGAAVTADTSPESAPPPAVEVPTQDAPPVAEVEAKSKAHSIAGKPAGAGKPAEKGSARRRPDDGKPEKPAPEPAAKPADPSERPAKDPGGWEIIR